VVKIDPATLPRAANIHYLGEKSYQELPAYLGGWDIALIPFKLNKSTKFISPTKTPEYLAGGKPVLSTPIRDVVNPYGMRGLVSIVENAEDFIEKAKVELGRKSKSRWLSKVDNFLRGNSWDSIWGKMDDLIQRSYHRDQKTQKRKTQNV
jgi:UDP-galactopyranose mutase